MRGPNRLYRELAQLKAGPAPEGTESTGPTVHFLAHCPAGADHVLNKITSVLCAADQYILDGRNKGNHGGLSEYLPSWFVSECASEQSPEELEQWLAWWKTLAPHEQLRAEESQRWSLEDWIYWFKPENRQWYWASARKIDPNTLDIAVEVDNWPFPWGALGWLLRAAGAEKIDAGG
jgi:hypothetical protein